MCVSEGSPRPPVAESVTLSRVSSHRGLVIGSLLLATGKYFSVSGVSSFSFTILYELQALGVSLQMFSNTELCNVSQNKVQSACVE